MNQGIPKDIMDRCRVNATDGGISPWSTHAPFMMNITALATQCSGETLKPFTDVLMEQFGMTEHEAGYAMGQILAEMAMTATPDGLAAVLVATIRELRSDDRAEGVLP